MRYSFVCFLALSALLLCACGDNGGSSLDSAQVQVLDMENYQVLPWDEAQAALAEDEVILQLHGEVRHFGADLTTLPPRGLPYRTTVADAQVWIADYPCSQGMNVRTDSSGHWQIHVLKKKDEEKRISFHYRKDFYGTPQETAIFGHALPSGWSETYASSNRILVGAEAPDTIGFQLPDEIFLAYAKGVLEAEVGSISNLLVVTVGQSWASLFSDSLPHGMAEAKALITPQLLTPAIYFNENVMPDPSLGETSKDGGVLFFNLGAGEYSITAEKSGEEFETVQFAISDEVRCYIASPPFAVQAK